MGTFKIEGGIRLKGEITPQGAKNEALQILCAVLLTPDKVTINNIPDIIDVNKLITLLGNLGVKIQRNSSSSITFQADEVNVGYLETEAFKKEGGSLRGSIMIVGPLLARFGKGYIPKPGGDKIGRRRLDTHFEGFINLGAKFRYNREDHFYGVEAPDGLKGTNMLLDEASVTGTANILMAAVLAKGKTTIYNAACEPYLQQLSKMLNSMGANITGVGSNLLTIEGVESLGGCEHTILPDMIEIGSWIGLAAMTRSEITIKNDSRVLPFGKFLRKSKINELPQLWNIFIGDMSIVGPRPMVPNTYARYPIDAQKVLNTVRPGLTGIGSIIFRDEERLLDGREDPIGFYIENITPHKSDLELWFVENNTLWLYIKIIFVTAWVVVFPSSTIVDKAFDGIPSLPNSLI